MIVSDIQAMPVGRGHLHFRRGVSINFVKYTSIAQPSTWYHMRTRKDTANAAYPSPTSLLIIGNEDDLCSSEPRPGQQLQD
jgi:hypothetical protein